jgi:hypothetical protein
LEIVTSSALAYPDSPTRKLLLSFSRETPGAASNDDVCPQAPEMTLVTAKRAYTGDRPNVPIVCFMF